MSERRACMKRLQSAETDEYQIEVIECDCGYHMGIDATYLIQMGDFETACPACRKILNTGDIVLV